MAQNLQTSRAFSETGRSIGYTLAFHLWHWLPPMTQASIRSVAPIKSNNLQKQIGLAAAAATVLIWAGYFLSLRLGALSPLRITELAILRYTLPGLLLLPIFLKSISAFKKVPTLYLLGIVAGSGFFFFWLSANAIGNTSVTHASTLIPGTLPLFVTLLAVTVFRQSFPKSRLWGFGLISVGILIMLSGATGQAGLSLFTGQLQLLFCALLWAVFTVSVRQSGLKPLQVSALVTVPNGSAVLIWFLVMQPQLSFMNMPSSSLILQLIVQTFLVGIFSGLFYSVAISRLGAEKTAVIGAFTPVVATTLAFFYLQEPLEFIPILGLCFTVVGVVTAGRHKTS